ncbi:UDP-2,3-diacylglucosamine diphosphatase [Thiohalorhabdus sp. Cl-TMA]|uniref:UDP-2,3-diacylglucosamine diphosphatase n=1 Tax=Thiohalorhabdus methylotrophus TaxID=3242694 RepID=A0ABV4TYQ4_9GAMM
MDNAPHPGKPHYRTIWISDVHLGFKGCQAEFLLDFLQSTTCDQLFLVGDIIDFWKMKSGIHWPQSHNDVVREVLGKAKRDTQVTLVPGNHDELLRDFDETELGNVHIRRQAVHTTDDGRRLLIMHGDEFDSVVQCSKLVALLGAHVYDTLIRLNRYVNWVRRKFGFPYWSLANYLKHKVKNAVNYISNFEHAIAHEARKQGADGLVCGHIHRAEITPINGVLYCNCGDWVESCTALVEGDGGDLQILHWGDEKQALKSSVDVLPETSGEPVTRVA